MRTPYHVLASLALGVWLYRAWGHPVYLAYAVALGVGLDGTHLAIYAWRAGDVGVVFDLFGRPWTTLVVQPEGGVFTAAGLPTAQALLAVHVAVVTALAAVAWGVGREPFLATIAAGYLHVVMDAVDSLGPVA